MLCLSESDTFPGITSPKSGSRQPESKKHVQGLGIEGHLMNLIPGKAHPCFPVPKKFPELRCYPEITGHEEDRDTSPCLLTSLWAVA